VWALVPLKLLDQVKNRLATVLTAEERHGLVIAMLRDVLDALCNSPELTGVLLVSREPRIQSLLPAHTSLHFWQEPSNCDLSGSITTASSHLKNNLNATGVMIVPADVPMISSYHVDSLLQGHHKVTLVPDDQNMGTNCLICTPPNNIPLLYNGTSFIPHLTSARDLNLDPAIVRCEAFGLDIDTPEDLIRLAYKVGNSHTGTYMQTSGISTRMLNQAHKIRTG
jgi:2-phospho-L-lactate guanylyltransferase